MPLTQLDTLSIELSDLSLCKSYLPCLKRLQIRHGVAEGGVAWDLADSLCPNLVELHVWGGSSSVDGANSLLPIPYVFPQASELGVRACFASPPCWLLTSGRTPTALVRQGSKPPVAAQNTYVRRPHGPFAPVRRYVYRPH